MDNLAISQFLSLFSWFAVAALIFFVLLIARFYQKFSGQRTQFQLFAVVIVIFGITTVRNTGLRQVSGDVIADTLSFVGGGLLLYLAIQLYYRMMKSNKESGNR